MLFREPRDFCFAARVIDYGRFFCYFVSNASPQKGRREAGCDTCNGSGELVIMRVLSDHLPADAFAGAVAVEANNGVLLISIERFDRIVKPTFWVLIWLRWKWIVDNGRPSVFLESAQNDFLVYRLPLESLHKPFSDPQFAHLGVPLGMYSTVRFEIDLLNADIFAMDYFSESHATFVRTKQVCLPKLIVLNS